MLVVLIGKTCSGKTTVAKKLVEEYGYNKIVTYTTRPKRPGEVDGVDYYFITDEDFKDKIESNFFFEYKSYVPANKETWYYGSHLPSDTDENDYVIILTPSGLEDLLKQESMNNISFYIQSNDDVLRYRLAQRQDDTEEAERRLYQDRIDFKYAPGLVDFIVCNDSTDISTLVEQIDMTVKEM